MWSIFKNKKCFITFEEAKEQMKPKSDTIYSTYFNVEGSFQIRISNSCNWTTGSVEKGFSVRMGDFPGGVMSKEEAKRLAYHLLEIVEKNDSSKM